MERGGTLGQRNEGQPGPSCGIVPLDPEGVGNGETEDGSRAARKTEEFTADGTRSDVHGQRISLAAERVECRHAISVANPRDRVGIGELRDIPAGGPHRNPGASRIIGALQFESGLVLKRGTPLQDHRPRGRIDHVQPGEFSARGPGIQVERCDRQRRRRRCGGKGVEGHHPVFVATTCTNAGIDKPRAVGWNGSGNLPGTRIAEVTSLDAKSILIRRGILPADLHPRGERLHDLWADRRHRVARIRQSDHHEGTRVCRISRGVDRANPEVIGAREGQAGDLVADGAGGKAGQTLPAHRVRELLLHLVGVFIVQEIRPRKRDSFRTDSYRRQRTGNRWADRGGKHRRQRLIEQMKAWRGILERHHSDPIGPGKHPQGRPRKLPVCRLGIVV